MASIKDQLLDKRIIDRNLEKGILSREQYEAHLKTLRDVEANAERVAVPDEDSSNQTYA
ncbi:MAG: hypothetical protein R3A47_12500 [Polyangiales bacterium]